MTSSFSDRTMATDRVARDGFTLASRSGGAGNGAPTILLLNSIGATMMSWEPQIAWLSHTHRVIGYDTRGHGASDTPPGPYSFDDLVADAVAVLDHHGVERATVIGLSLGGMTAMGLALAHPERVGRLVVCAARADAPPPFRSSWDDRIAAIRAGGMEAIWPGTEERWFPSGFAEECPTMLARMKAAFLATPVEGYAGCAAALKTLNYLEDLRRLRMPSFFVAGEWDAGAPVDAMRTMAATAPDSRFAVIAGAMHIVNLNNPEGFRRDVEGFLAS